MYQRRTFLTYATVGMVMCTAGLIPSISQAASSSDGVSASGKGASYAETHGLTADDVKNINALNERALTLGKTGKPSPRARRALSLRQIPPAEPLNRMPDPYWAFDGRATTGVSNYIRKWQQAYSHRAGQIQQMTAEQREMLSYGCVGVTAVNSGSYPTNKLAFSFFDERKYQNLLKDLKPKPNQSRTDFEARIAKNSFDEEKGFKRARDVASIMNKALENARTEVTYMNHLKAELTNKNDPLLHQGNNSNFYSALSDTPSFRDRNGGNYDPSKMKAVVYAKHFWSGQSGSTDVRKYGDPSAFRPDPSTGLVDMSKDRNTARNTNEPGESWINFDYGWFGAQEEVNTSNTIWTHANHAHQPNGGVGPMNVYESKFYNWSAGYEDFDRGTYIITFIPKTWNTAPTKITQGWP